MSRVAVLGVTGMLGAAVYTHLYRLGRNDVFGTWHSTRPIFSDKNHRFVQYEVKSGYRSLLQLLSGVQVVVNCTAVLNSGFERMDSHQVREGFMVNSIFPKTLAEVAENLGIRVLSISSDAVFNTNYATERIESERPTPMTLYGWSKLLGEIESRNVINLRTSVIGRDPHKHKGLLEWFLALPQGTTIQGYSDSLWQGVTTPQLASLVADLVNEENYSAARKESGVFHYCPNPAITKYDLLCLFAKVFEKRVQITPSPRPGGQSDQTMRTHFSILNRISSQEKSLEASLLDLNVICFE